MSSTAVALFAPERVVRIVPLTDHLRSASPPRLRLVPALPASAARPPAPPSPPPPPGGEIRQLLTGVLEVLDGRRPVAQLTDLVPQNHQRTLIRQARLAGPGPRTLRSMHLTRTTPEAVDLCARIDHGRRCTALTGRLEPTEGRWRFTLLALI